MAGDLSARHSIGRRVRTASLALLLIALPATAPSQSVDLGAVDRIIEEGMRHSEVMATARHLTDVIGARLTNSPGARKAEAWTQERFRSWGLKNVRKEGFAFGRGWWAERSSVRMLAPRPMELTAVPISWTPSTVGPIAGPIVLAPIEKVEDFTAWKGKLAGRIVLITRPETAQTPLAFSRHSADELAKLGEFQPPEPDTDGTNSSIKRHLFPRALDAFLKAEGAIAYARMTRRDGKLVMGDGYLFAVDDTPLVPGVEIAVEDYRRLIRLAEIGQTPTVEIDTLVHYDDSDTQAYNIFADIPGSEPEAAYVMAGAHLDSAAAADGAADNGAGVAMVMEAARILAKMPRPKRTIRFALWGAEEQGFVGSIDFVEKYLATRGRRDEPQLQGRARFLTWMYRWPITPRPGWDKLSVYFNLDNGSGKIRGIYAEGNQAAVPIFQAWQKPFESMGVSTVAVHGNGGSDNYMLHSVGVPGFQFIQDWNDYGRMHHTSMDTYDHLNPDDMRQASVVLASFLWNAANMDRPFPRRPLAKKPTTTDRP